MVSQELLDILRCPVCVHNEPEGGDLEKRGNWLICATIVAANTRFVMTSR